MQRIPNLISNRIVGRRKTTTQVNYECGWIFDGPVIARRKWNGVCVSFDGKEWWVRHQVGPGHREPRGFVPVDFNEMTENITGWVPVENSRYHKHWTSAISMAGADHVWLKGTYELVGPRVCKNPEKLEHNILVRHVDSEEVSLPEPLTCESLCELVQELHETKGWEGLIFQEVDGFGIAKLKWTDL